MADRRRVVVDGEVLGPLLFLIYIRKYSFSQRTIIEWNNLSTDCVTASSVNMFKNKVDRYLRIADYTSIKNVGLSISQ